MTETICLECGRTARHEARGLCSPCRQRLRRWGEIERYPKRLRAFDKWFALIDRTDPTACWPWPGPLYSNGYGQTSGSGGTAHREVYKRMVGPIPDGLIIDHVCHNNSGCPGGAGCPHRSCVNWVNHLEAVTPKANQLRSPNTFAALNALKTHCPQGHPYSGKNLIRTRSNCRLCRECQRAANRAYKAKRRLTP